MLLFPGWGGGIGGMEENKKSGVGDVRAKALSWDIEWEKAKNVFFGFFPLAPTVAQCAPLTSLAARKKKSLREKKVGFAEKKHAYRFTKSRIYRIYRIYRIAASAKPAIGDGSVVTYVA